jgi:hypothetical protein
VQTCNYYPNPRTNDRAACTTQSPSYISPLKRGSATAEDMSDDAHDKDKDQVDKETGRELSDEI